MNRRSALGFLGIGAVTGPAIAQEAVNKYGHPSNPVPYIDNNAIGFTHINKDHDYMKECREKLSYLTTDPAKWIAEKMAEELRDYQMGYSGIHYNSIDPDIRNMKSFTESAKMRMYIERRVKRQYESQKTSLMNQIAGYIGVK
jgi:hypothetical protein